MNLVVNARDAMPDGGRLDIKTTNADVHQEDSAAHADARSGRYVVLTISDTGIGMDENTRQHVFEPFFTTKERDKGTGLGLSTVYGILRQNGGWIQMSTEVGIGTSFELYFPRIDARPLPERSDAPKAAASSGETILLVEDQDAVRQLMISILGMHGYHILEAANGDEALDICQGYSGEIHLLLTDVVLPGINGRELGKRLKALRPKLSELFTSGYPLDIIAHRGVLESGIAYIPKPFKPDELAAKVREALTETPAPR